MAEDVLQQIMEAVNNNAVEQFPDMHLMVASSGGVVTREQGSTKLNIRINTVQCPDKEVLINLSSSENKEALEAFSKIVTKSQHIGKMFKNVNLPAELVDLVAVDVQETAEQCLKNYDALEAKDPKKIARR